MKKYFINSNPFSDARHIIHLDDCPLLPEPGRKLLLGEFLSKAEARKQGVKYFHDIGFCRFCLHDVAGVFSEGNKILYLN